MASNRKLTALIKGRTIISTRNADDTLKIGFDDGSTMTVQTAGSSASAATGKIRAVRQQDTRFSLDFEDGRTVEITTAEVTSSVMLRDKDGVMEYAD